MNKRIQIRIDKETEEKLNKLVEKYKISKSSVIRMLINDFVEKIKK